MDWLFVVGVVLFVLVLIITVGIHEAGHMAAAKALKLDVPEYSIGFGPKLLSKKTKNTNYHLRAIPLGGFVMINDNRYPEKSYERGSLSRVAPWKRQIVFFAGPAVNLIVGTALLLTVLISTPYQERSNHVGYLFECESSSGCAALTAGLQEGDKIVEIDGVAINSYEDLVTEKQDKAMLASLVVEREGEKREFTNLKLKFDEEADAFYIGIKATKDSYRTIPEAWTFVTYSFERNIIGLAKLPEKAPSVIENIATGNKGEEDPASVVAAGKSYGDMTADLETEFADKVFTFFYWSALFNIGIGLINLLPFLPLDGGRMWIALCDSFKMRWAKLTKKEYKPVSATMFGAMATVSAIVIFGFMGLIILSDISAIVAGTI